MSTVTIAVDLAKNVFEIVVVTRAGAVQEHRRLSRLQFEQFWRTRTPCRVVTEACSGSHFWARDLTARGFDVTLLPPHYIKPYRVAARLTARTAKRYWRQIGAPAFIRSRSRVVISRRSARCTGCAHSGCRRARPASTQCVRCG